jgi:parallel beta-helix repeat protein
LSGATRSGPRRRDLARGIVSVAALVLLLAPPWSWFGPGGLAAMAGELDLRVPDLRLVPPVANPGGTPAASGAAPSATPDEGIRYVSIDGSDDAAGTSEDPWRTVQHAVDAAPAGGVVSIGPGTFDGFTVRRSGLTIRGVAGTVIRGDTDVILVEDVTSARLSDLEVTGARFPFGAGIRVNRSSGVIVERTTLRDNRSFGIKVADSTEVTIRDNDIGHNETGIEISRAGEGIAVLDNLIHDNDRMVTASRGGNGIVFHLTTGAITVGGNRLWGNRAPHLDDAGYDGGAFEVYGASNLLITGNLLWDNNNTMETGTDGVAPCTGNTFSRNTVRALGAVPGQTEGLILRCAEAMQVAHNTFDGLDGYAFYVSADGAYSGSIAGLAIRNNIVVRGRAFSLAAGLPAGLVIDHNVVWPGGSAATYGDRVAYVEGRGNTDRLAEFTTWTGYMVHGLQADPRLVAPDAGDYHLAAGSPAIDAGTPLGDPYAGAAPDPGRYEAGP